MGDPGSCPSCGAELPVAARFCPSCGQALHTEPALEERRIVTVVFADIEGFTALAEHRDPESVKELLDACFGRLVPVIAAHGGNVDKIIGDELMAVFGAPVAHEDDPERAVRAALELAPALDRLDQGLRLRVGVNTGEVLAGAIGPSLGYTVTGDVVNTAHRLVTAARPGEVLVGERTHQATRSVVSYALRGDLDLKGKHDLVRAWVAQGIQAGAKHRGPDRAGVRLVGRDREVEEINAMVGDALRHRRPEVVTVVGEPGVGKTRLALEIAVLVASEPLAAQVLWVSCPPYGPGGDLAPLADLVRTGLGVATSPDRVAQRALLAERVARLVGDIGTDSGRLASRLASLLGLGHLPARAMEPETGPARAGVTDQQLGAVRRLLGLLSAERPLLLVVDDLHWAGPDLVRFLAQIPTALGDHPIVVLGLARDDLLERRSDLVGAGPGRSTRTLEPLADDATASLAVSLLAGHGHEVDDPRVGPGSLDRLVAVAGGNPLLLEQLVRYLVESGALVDIEGRWQWEGEDQEGLPDLPDGVRSLISARLDGLPADERQVLASAAVGGRRFWRDAVRELADTPDTDALLDRLDERGLIEPIADEGFGDQAFRHVLTRDVAYAALPIGERATRHARLARWLDVRFGAVDEPAPIALLAHHYERAVVLARSVDHTDPGVAGAAFEALVRAARDEYRRDGQRRADHWYRRARDLGSLDADAMLTAVAEHGQVLLRLRHLDAAREAFEEVQRRAGSRRPTEEASALAHLGAVARLGGDTDLARERFEAAAARWRELGDLQGLVDTLRLEGWCELTAGRFRAALPRLQRAAALEEQLDRPAGRGATLQYLGWCEFLSGDMNDARTHLWEAMAHSLEADDQGAIGWCFGLLASTLLHGGQAARSLELTEDLRKVAQRNNDPWGEWTCVTLQASAHLALGDAALALELATEAQHRFEELDDAWGLALACVVRAQAARDLGDLVTARGLLVEVIASSRDLTYVGEDARLLVELARVELEAGNLVEAGRQARAGLALVRAGIGDHESGLRSLVVLAEIERSAGSVADGELLLEEAAAERDPADRTDAWRQAAVLLAGLRIAAGDRPRARHLVEQCEDPGTDDVRIQAALPDLRATLDGP